LVQAHLCAQLALVRAERRQVEDSENPWLDWLDWLDDDGACLATIERVVDRHPAHLIQRAMARKQASLRRLLSEGAWQLYLEIEELSNERTADLQLTLVRWAFREGMRCATGPREG
jgi:hypothetical protein